MTAKASIRNATMLDLKAILKIEYSSFMLLDRFSVALFIYYLHKYKDNFFVAVDPSGSVVAYAILSEENGSGYVFSLAVHPKNRHQGYAKHLLQFMEKKCQQKQFPKLSLDVRVDNKSAIELYKKQGLTEVLTKKDFYGNGIDGLLMEKQLQ